MWKYVKSQRLSYVDRKPHCVLYVFMCIYMVIHRATAQNFSYTYNLIGVAIQLVVIVFIFLNALHCNVLFTGTVVGIWCCVLRSWLAFTLQLP